jgi:hypothetical protein
MRNAFRSTNVEFARCFLRLANLPDCALDRLSRYEGILWRQVRQILIALDALERSKTTGQRTALFPYRPVRQARGRLELELALIAGGVRAAQRAAVELGVHGW